jgi:hypothetical protein
MSFDTIARHKYDLVLPVTPVFLYTRLVTCTLVTGRQSALVEILGFSGCLKIGRDVLDNEAL